MTTDPIQHVSDNTPDGNLTPFQALALLVAVSHNRIPLRGGFEADYDTETLTIKPEADGPRYRLTIEEVADE